MVIYVGVSVDVQRQSAEEFLNQVRAKYGAPTIKLGVNDYRWCTPGEKQCDFMQNPQLPLIHAVSYTNNQLELRSGEDANNQLKQALKDAVDRRVPAGRRTAF